MRYTFCLYHTSLLLSWAFVGCAGGALPMSEGNEVSKIAEATCPTDTSSASAIASTKFGLEADLEQRAQAALTAGAIMQETARDVQAEVLEACTAIAGDLGVPQEQLRKGDSKDELVQTACVAAADAIAKTRASIKGGAKIDVRPPRCTVSMEAMTDCLAECEAKVEPGEVQLRCEGGEVSGKCDGTCKGTCTIEGAAECKGECTGECKGECSGEVVGRCDGTCKGACEGGTQGGQCDGICRGTCEGNVEGQCSATCSGSCDAECNANVDGECKGTCSGQCSVEFKKPQCDGELNAPSASAECRAECDARATADVACDPAQVSVAGTVETDSETVEKLAKTLKANLPVLLRMGQSLGPRLEATAAMTHESVANMKATLEGAGSEGTRVVGCFVAALQGQVAASASIKISVEASASVSASASGSSK